jgi:hypothetical protein
MVLRPKPPTPPIVLRTKPPNPFDIDACPTSAKLDAFVFFLDLADAIYISHVDACHSFKSPVIAAAIACYSLLRQGAAICVLVQFSRYIPL